ncbi:MAG: PA0069 family radical SAM protein [Azospirillum sp.]|nr:PA0069 family radical SAM protein [Azospirillum sp.]MCA3265408.1 PA0069 family radical SAM protein [Azospirillum sp.]MCZ8122509.1 PA0069 family radical SAM protein [Magnetospirillum sp.]
MDEAIPDHARKGRGAVSNAAGRYEPTARVRVDDGWGVDPDSDLPPLRTTLQADASRTVIARNDSPDIPFAQSINPYRGCEHGCVYCYARPSHAYLGLSPGLDFETKLFFKPDAAKLLAAELRKPGYKPSAIALGSNTDPYQPAERDARVTRAILETLRDFRHPFSIVTKGALVARDIDILAPMAELRLARVFVSVTTLDRDLARRMEPRASAPQRRLAAIRALADAGVEVGVMAAPMIPALNDHELEAILEAARAAGARTAGYTLLRLPLEIKDLFDEWLDAHAPLRKGRVLDLIRQSRDGKLNHAEFGTRFVGTGPYAALLNARFLKARKRLGLDRNDWSYDLSRFAPPPQAGDQMTLF